MQSYKDIINYDNKKKRYIEKKIHFIFCTQNGSIWFCSTVAQYKLKVTNSY